MRWALAGSALLHAAVAALWLVGPVPRRQAEEVPPIEVELVQQASMQKGGAAMPAQAPPAPPDDRPSDAGEAARPPPSPPAQASAAATPAVNLGDGPRDLDALSVTGEGVVPPAPDAAFRNRPPSYPLAAARARAEGTVQLMIHVSAAGMPEQVVVASSSGNPALDRAARDAVLLWRFRPALSGGNPVPFDYQMNIRFTLGDGER